MNKPVVIKHAQALYGSVTLCGNPDRVKYVELMGEVSCPYCIDILDHIRTTYPLCQDSKYRRVK